MRLRSGHAVFQWTHREFEAPDPWSGNRLEKWQLVVYQMVRGSQVLTTPVQPQFLPSEANSLPLRFPVGIALFESNRHVMLPMVLQRLWRDGLVDDRRLPDMLHRAESRTLPRDLPGSNARIFRWVGYAYGILALGVLALAFFLQPADTGFATPEAEAASLCRWLAAAIGLLSAWAWALAIRFQRRQNALREFFLALVANHS